MEEVGNPYCDLCHVPVAVPLVPPLAPMEGVPLQTSGHLVAECGFFNSIREEIFGLPYAMPIEQIKKKDILLFMVKTGLMILPTDREERDQIDYSDDSADANIHDN